MTLAKLALRSLLAAAALANIASSVRAQNLELAATGGSLPGVVHIDAFSPQLPFNLMVIVPSSNAGPTSCQLFDAADFRSLGVGIELLGLAWAGISGLDGHFAVQFPVPATPSLQDLPLIFQAVTFLWGPTLLDQISNNDAVRFGNAGAFRDRLVFTQFDRAFATVLPRNDHKWLLVGGARGTLLAQQAWQSTEIHDPITDSASPGPSLNTPRSLHTATQLPNGTWLIAGGVNASNDPQATCEIYDPVLDVFTPCASMGSARMGHSATMLGNGKVFVAGGIQAMPVTPTQLEPIHQTVSTSELYDPVANTWTPGPALSTPRAGHAAMVRPDGRVVLAGGISWDTSPLFGWLPAVRRSSDIYNPATNAIAAGPQMAFARSLTDPVDLGSGRFLVAGGINAITIIPYNPGNPTATAEIYDSTANTWTTVGSLATARGNHRAWALPNGTFVLAGGANGSVLSPTALSSTEIFSPATNVFTPGPAMNYARAGAAAFHTPHGQMHLFGGATTGGQITASTEWYYF